MSINDKPLQTKCPTCTQSSAERSATAALSRLAIDESGESRPTSGWTAATNSFTRNAMSPHPKCAACSILMGPGHIESGTDGLCGTCREAGRGIAERGEPEALGRPSFGKRGWLRDR